MEELRKIAVEDETTINQLINLRMVAEKLAVRAVGTGSRSAPRAAT